MPFKFGIRVTNLKKLSELLFESISMFFGDRSTDAFFIYQHTAHTFYLDALDQKIETETWGLLSVEYSLLEDS
ncbi:MAG: hypothetical protein ABI402_04945 [Ferruginibacter sp.]